MRLSPATLLVVVMFGSFAVILATMVLVFAPEPSRRPPRPGKRALDQTTARGGTRTATEPARADTGAVPALQTAAGSVAKAVEPAPSEAPAVAKEAAPKPPPGGEAERQLHRKLKQERKEMALLRDEMKRRLEEQLANRKQKLAQLAAQCEKLEPGEAAQILLSLDDDELAEVLRRVERDAALKIAALLERLGRQSAGAIQ